MCWTLAVDIDALDPEFPLKDFLGMQIRGLEPGVVGARLTLGDQHRNPHGVTHGAVLFAMVDTAMGGATMSVLDDGVLCTTIDVDIRFIRPAIAGELRATARVIKRGRTVVHLSAEIHDDDDRLVATALGSFAVLSPS